MNRLSIAALALLLCAGCGTGMKPPTRPAPGPQCVSSTAPSFVYVLNYSDATISMYAANSCTGALTSTTPPTVPTGINTGINAESMVVDRAGKFLYVANLVSNATDQATVSMFTIDQTTGVLTPTSPAMVPTGFFPQGIAIDPSGKFVYTANSDDNSVSMFTVDSASGLLTPTLPASMFVPPVFPSRSLDSSPGFVSVDPAGHFLYVSDQDNGSISVFAIDQTTGLVTATDPAGVTAGIDPFGLTLDPSGKFAYVPDRGTNMVWMYTVDAITGALTPTSTAAVSAGNQPGTMAVHPSGKYAYVVNRQDNTVSIFSIDSATGNLSPLSPVTVNTGAGPWPMMVNATGTFAYVGNQSDNTVSIFGIDAKGKLSTAGTARTGADPVSIAIAH
jgi:6-phosphogluconolactonase